MSEALIRQARYTPVLGRVIPDGLLRCGSCGSMVAPGGEDLHERLHPRIPCDVIHPGANIHCIGIHAWDEQFS